MRVRLTVNQARRVATLLAEDREDTIRRFTVFGNLVTVGVVEQRGARKGRTLFEFETLGGKMYKGILHSELVASRLRFLVPVHGIEATIEEAIDVNPLTGDESIDYILVDVGRLPHETETTK